MSGQDHFVQRASGQYVTLGLDHEVFAVPVELVRDIAQRLLPVETRDVAAMIDELKLARLLAGYRGKPAADRKALEATALGLARFYLDHRARIAEVELNPLMVRQDGAVAVDVRVVWQAEPSAR